ncbi:hypothetical protein [Mycoplasma procyoni]|nr:hypothetical protein [Mycoplasma procyoni]
MKKLEEISDNLNQTYSFARVIFLVIMNFSIFVSSFILVQYNLR